MPRLIVTTKTAQEVWRSPDGQRVIYELGLDYNGKMLQAKTYSGAIASVGWNGEVESYEKQGRNGMETFVKQPPKEGGSYGGGGGGGGGGGSKFEKDPFTMYLSYAKDLLVALVETKGYDNKEYNELLDAAIVGGKQLYDNRPGNEQKKDVVTDTVAPVPENITIEDIKGIFDDDIPKQETAWPKNP